MSESSPFSLSLSNLSSAQLLLLSALALPVVFVCARSLVSFSKSTSASTTTSAGNDPAKDENGDEDEDLAPKSVMSPENPDLAPPKDDGYTLAQLSAYDGRDPTKPIYVAIKGTIFDVSAKREMYGPGKSYNIFAGKDGSKGLGLSSLKEEDAVPDYGDLPPAELKVLNDWHAFFSRRYNIVGRVVDYPEVVAGR